MVFDLAQININSTNGDTTHAARSIDGRLEIADEVCLLRQYNAEALFVIEWFSVNVQ